MFGEHCTPPSRSSSASASQFLTTSARSKNNVLLIEDRRGVASRVATREIPRPSSCAREGLHPRRPPEEDAQATDRILVLTNANAGRPTGQLHRVAFSIVFTGKRDLEQGGSCLASSLHSLLLHGAFYLVACVFHNLLRSLAPCN